MYKTRQFCLVCVGGVNKLLDRQVTDPVDFNAIKLNKIRMLFTLGVFEDFDLIRK